MLFAQFLLFRWQLLKSLPELGFLCLTLLAGAVRLLVLSLLEDLLDLLQPQVQRRLQDLLLPKELFPLRLQVALVF